MKRDQLHWHPWQMSRKEKNISLSFHHSEAYQNLVMSNVFEVVFLFVCFHFIWSTDDHSKLFTLQLIIWRLTASLPVSCNINHKVWILSNNPLVWQMHYRVPANPLYSPFCLGIYMNRSHQRKPRRCACFASCGLDLTVCPGVETYPRGTRR